MGTRGCYGFRKNGIDKITYNQYDSYPDCLGRTMVEFCKNTSIQEMNEIFDRIILVDGYDKPTPEQITACRSYYNGNVGRQSPDDWYCLLREAQGEPNAYKNGLRYMIDSHEFIKDSLFCEYAYIIDLNTNKLEFYVGFQMQPDIHNRYGTDSDRGYYPCKMKASYSLKPQFWSKRTVESVVEKMNKACGTND